MFAIRFINMGYTSERKFAEPLAAVEHARSCGFEAAIENEEDGQTVALYSPITGVKTNWR